MKSSILAVGFFGACVVAAGACTVTEGDGDGGGGSSSSSSSSSASSSSSSGGGQGGGDTNACVTKCDTDNPLSDDAKTNILVGLIKSCGCAADGICNAKCDTADQASDFCAADGTVVTTATNDACVGCANEALDAFTDACVGSITDSCGDDAVCTAWAMCINNCP